MPHYCFYCPQGREVAGCVERICCCTPFIRPKVNQHGQQLVNPQTRQPIAEPDAQKTWQWLISLGYAFPPGVDFACTILNPMMDQSQRAPSVYCVQHSAPSATRAPIDAPYAQPVGNRGQQGAPLPMAGQPRVGNAGAYEVLPDTALPGNSDPMLGEIDGAGGTYMDLDSAGNEIPRQNQQLSSPTVHQRVAQNQQGR